MGDGSWGLVFGPVRSRRLGVSLGVNNIPYKVCSYSCVYCQLGRTLRLSVERRPYSSPEAVVRAVARALEEYSGHVDYVTFVPDGEPTLDTMLGRDIEALKGELGVRVAVLTNASLLWLPEVRRGLLGADLVSVKVDAVREETWRRLDRPHPSLRLREVLEGIRVFAEEYGGVLLTETMLVRGLNDAPGELEAVADFIASLGPARAYVAVPTRPPAEPWVEPAGAEAVTALHEALRERGVDAELLTHSEPPPRPPRAAGPGEALEWLAAVLSVHPHSREAVERLAAEMGLAPGEAVRLLMERYGVEETRFRGRVFLVRRPLPRRLGGRGAPSR